VESQPLLADGTVVNSAPVNTVPGPLAANGSLAVAGVSVADVNGNLASVQITATQGTVSASLSGGATILAGANATATFTLGGTQAQINSALRTIGYTPTSGYNGPATVTMFSKDSSDANDSDTIAITVITSTNTPPVATNDSAPRILQGRDRLRHQQRYRCRWECSHHHCGDADFRQGRFLLPMTT